MEYKHRIIEYHQEMLIGFPVILLAGPRQVGKTTLLKYLASKFPRRPNFVTLDDINLRIQAEDDPQGFLDAYDTPLVIDEFQYAPKLLSYIKMRVDKARQEALFTTHKQVETMYFLTGSQVFETMGKVSESLAGRIGLCNLYALSARELDGGSRILNVSPFVPEISELKKRTPSRHLSQPELFKQIVNGFYPELVVNQQISAEQFYSSYIKTYLERDVRSIAAIKDEVKFLKFIRCLAARTAQEYNASDIASDVQIDSKTADEWLSILKNTYLVHLLQPYSNNLNSRAIKRPKIYFTDTGLASYLAGYTGSQLLENSAYSGAIFETYVVGEIIKSYVNSGVDISDKLYYYRDYAQKEIDLVIRSGDNLYPVEIKKTSTIPGIDAIKNFETLDKLIVNSNQKVSPGIVICNIEEVTPLHDGHFAIPVEKI